MVNNQQTGSVGDLLANLLDRGYERATSQTLRAITSSMNSGIVAQRLDELDAEIARLAEADERLARDNPVLRSLLTDVETQLRRDAARIDVTAEDLQRLAIDDAGTIQRQLALPGMGDDALTRIGIQWNTPDPEAVARLVEYVNDAAWAEMLDADYVEGLAEHFNDVAIRGIVNGWNPRRTARVLREQVENLPIYRANNLMRTLQLTSYRDATAIHQEANKRLAEEVIRIATLDSRTCLACVAQHGDVIWRSSDGGTVPRVQDHHQGRCTSVVRVRGRELGIQSGEDWWAGLPDERKRRQQSLVNTPAKFNALDSGEVGLRDFVQPYEDRVFGEMMREASLSGVLGERASQFYVRNQI